MGNPTFISGLADYTYGEKQVKQLVQYFDALHRPAEFEAAVEAVYASYENTRTSSAILAATVRDTAMKQIGADASNLMVQIQNAQEAKAIASGKPPGLRAPALPSGGTNAVYTPKPDKPKEPDWLTDALWTAAKLAALGLAGYGVYRVVQYGVAQGAEKYLGKTAGGFLTRR